MKAYECENCGRRGLPWRYIDDNDLHCIKCGGLIKTYEVEDPPTPPQYRVVAVANTVFRGHSVEEVKENFMSRAETLDENEWTFILVEPVQSLKGKVNEGE